MGSNLVEQMSSDKEVRVYIHTDGTILRGTAAEIAILLKDIEDLRRALPPPEISITLQQPSDAITPQSRDQNANTSRTTKESESSTDSSAAQDPTVTGSRVVDEPVDGLASFSSCTCNTENLGASGNEASENNENELMPKSQSSQTHDFAEDEAPTVESRSVVDSSSDPDENVSENYISTEDEEVNAHKSMDINNNNVDTTPSQGEEHSNQNRYEVKATWKKATASAVAVGIDSKIRKKNVKVKDIKISATALAAAKGTDVN